jgi:hypothetical protein
MNNFNLLVKFPQNADFTDLDIDDDFNISLNYQIDDILDISKRNTSYSKTVSLPGTQKNNLFFKSVFDVNVNNISFNPTKRVGVLVTVTDAEVFRGDLQLINIKINTGEVSYEVVLTGKLRDILTEMGDLSIKELDLSEYNHTRNAQNIIDSWEYKVFINNNLTEVNGPGVGYVYPHIFREVPSSVFSNDPLVTVDYNYYPAVYVKTVIDKLFQYTNYTYTSNFFNTEYFKRLILPYVNDKFTIDEEEFNSKMLYVGINPAQGESAEFPINTGYVSLAGVFNRNGVWYENSDFSYYFPLNRTTGPSQPPLVEESPFQFQNPSGSWGEFNGWECTEAGYYDLSLRLTMIPKWFSASGTDFKYDGNGKFYYRYKIVKIIGSSNPNVTQYVQYYVSDTLAFQPSDDVFHQSPWYDTTTELILNGEATNVYLTPGDRIGVKFEAVYPITDLDGNTTEWDVDGAPDVVRMRLVARPFSTTGGSIEYSRLKISKSTSQTYGQETDFMNQALPNIKMKDFFLDIVKMFNLVIVDDPNDSNNLIIEPRDDYYSSKQKVLDWNYILDRDSEIKITPMSELDATTYLFKYTDDNDWLNTEYTEETKKSWGELELNVDNDFSVNTNKTEIKFSPTPVGNYSYQPGFNNYVAPQFLDYDGIIYKPKKVKPRILFYGGLIPISESNPNANNFVFIDSLNPGFQNAYSFSTFPYCGMWDHPTNPRWDLGFGRTDKIYWDSDQFPTQTLYEKYHKATLNNIIDINSKLLEGSFHLTPKDIALLDFRDIIFLDGQYWRINKVKDYNPIGSDELTKVELYLISDIKTYDKEQISITTSNDSCPTDVVAKLARRVWYYVSQSGIAISESCCKQLNGQFIEGRCRVRRKPDVIDFNPAGPAVGVSGPIGTGVIVRPVRFKSGGPFITPVSQKSGPTSNQNNNNDIKSPSLVLGSNNTNVNGSIVVGSNNTIGPNTQNVVVIGNNIYADESGTLYFEGGYFNSNGEFIKSNFYIIEGGEDEVLYVMKENLIDVVDGTEDAIRNFGGDSKERPVIDGNITFSVGDNPPELN